MDDDRTIADSLAHPADEPWVVTLHPSINDIPPEDWDRCAGTHNPLQCHALLKAMEDSGSAVAETGWIPRHLSLSRGSGGGGGGGGAHIRGVMPFYIKTHSYGEYVFDHAWAQAWSQVGGDYYPKGQAAIPFSPVPGQRLLVEPDAPQAVRRAAGQAAQLALAEGAIEAGAAMELSSLHITFLSRDETDLLASSGRGWIRRRGMQFHWHNRDYHNFDTFLATMASRKRKTIRRERRSHHRTSTL